MTVAVTVGVFFVFAVAQASTTISTSITTGGNLTVTGTSAFTGDAAFAHASTTQFTSSGNVWVNGFATTTASNGNFATAGTLTVVGASTFTGDAGFQHASTTQLTSSGNVWVNGNATTTASTGAFATEGNITISGSAKTLTVTTANSATSTAIVGCIQTYATSTDTPVKLIMGSQNAEATTTITNTTVAGYVVWAFGSCPSF